MAHKAMKPRSRPVRIHVELEGLGIERYKRLLYPPEFDLTIVAGKACIGEQNS
jgi:hypothetical protein